MLVGNSYASFDNRLNHLVPNVLAQDYPVWASPEFTLLFNEALASRPLHINGEITDGC